MKTKPDDHAFPADYGAAGLTKREYFAALMMQAYMSYENFPTFEQMAKESVQAADILIKELNKA